MKKTKKSENIKENNSVKYILGLFACLVLRMIPFKPANVEPVTATIMPFGKKLGWLLGALFGALSIVLFDLIHPTPGFPRLGVWTLATAAMFALMGAASGLYLKNKENKIRYYVGFSIVATLVYDFITGPVMSSIIWQMPFSAALIGQIPFTLWHLGGNITLSIILSPSIYYWIVDNRKLEWNFLSQKFLKTRKS
jgi:hypothetical protein